MARRHNSGRHNHYLDRSFTRNTGNLGVDETVRRLLEMGEHVVQAAKDAMKQGADEIVADAKSRCPVKTGRLRDSIKATPNRDGTSYDISADARNEDGFLYGQIVEFSPKEGYRPFLYPAFEANVGRVYNNVREAVEHATRR